MALSSDRGEKLHSFQIPSILKRCTVVAAKLLETLRGNASVIDQHLAIYGINLSNIGLARQLPDSVTGFRGAETLAYRVMLDSVMSGRGCTINRAERMTENCCWLRSYI